VQDPTQKEHLCMHHEEEINNKKAVDNQNPTHNFDISLNWLINIPYIINMFSQILLKILKL